MSAQQSIKAAAIVQGPSLDCSTASASCSERVTGYHIESFQPQDAASHYLCCALENSKAKGPQCESQGWSELASGGPVADR